MPRTLTSIVAAASIVAASALPAGAAPDGPAPSAITWQGPLRTDLIGDVGPNPGVDLETYRMSYDSATDELVAELGIQGSAGTWLASLYVDLDRDRSTGCDGADREVAVLVQGGVVTAQARYTRVQCGSSTETPMPITSQLSGGVLRIRIPASTFDHPVSIDWRVTLISVPTAIDESPASRSDYVEEHGWVRPFSDVRTDAFYSGPIAWLRQTGFSTGIGTTGTYVPDGPVTRGQMATFLWRIVLEQDAPPAPFTDVQRPSFYAAAVDWLYDADVTTGVGGTNQFRPDEPVTRGQMVTFLWRMQGSPTGHPAPGFTDVGTAAFYFDAVAWAKAEGITTGIGGTDQFRPDDVVTRGQMAAFLQRTFAPYSSAIYMT